CVPYISWVLPLYFVTQSWGIYDTYVGLLLPHVAVHICFFSWLMKGFFDGIDPSMEYAAMIDGCSRWGAFIRVAIPSALPAISALAVLCWLFTWNEFLFALILTGNRVPMLTVVMAQFVTEMGLRWNLMAATAVMALGPAFLSALFGQKYVIRGLRIYGKNNKQLQEQGGKAMQGLVRWVIAATAALLAVTGNAAAQVTELRIGYQPSPIQDASIAMFEAWGAKNGVKIVKVPNSYGV